jgi:putative transposase
MMPRKLRFIIPGMPVHIVQRGHNRSAVFFEDEDYLAYIGWLKQAASRYSCHVHAYVLMTNHIHILATPEDNKGITRMMQYIGRCYVPYINNKYGRSGSLWEGRYKASLVQEEAYLLRCMRYVELNPVRAGMVSGPGDYSWSSHHSNSYGGGGRDDFLDPHVIYQELAGDKVSRQAAYLALFESVESDEALKKINACWQTGVPLGDSRFKAEVETILGRKVGYSRRGRPSEN